MNGITHTFNLIAYVMGGLLFLAIILLLAYARWRAAGQERGI
jgi:hypothetical protein